MFDPLYLILDVCFVVPPLFFPVLLVFKFVLRVDRTEEELTQLRHCSGVRERSFNAILQAFQLARVQQLEYAGAEEDVESRVTPLLDPKVAFFVVQNLGQYVRVLSKAGSEGLDEGLAADVNASLHRQVVGDQIQLSWLRRES